MEVRIVWKRGEEELVDRVVEAIRRALPGARISVSRRYRCREPGYTRIYLRIYAPRVSEERSEEGAWEADEEEVIGEVEPS